MLWYGGQRKGKSWCGYPPRRAPGAGREWEPQSRDPGTFVCLFAYRQGFPGQPRRPSDLQQFSLSPESWDYRLGLCLALQLPPSCLPVPSPSAPGAQALWSPSPSLPPLSHLWPLLNVEKLSLRQMELARLQLLPLPCVMHPGLGTALGLCTHPQAQRSCRA